jgi:hypothetical protein
VEKIISLPGTGEKMIVTREAAKILNCSMRHVRTLGSKEILRPFKMGAATTLYRLEEVRAYAKEKADGRKKGKVRGAVPGGFRADESRE